MAENCEKCKFRAHYDKGGTRDVDNIVGGYQPNSFLGKFFAEQSDQRSSAGGGISISAQAGKVISPVRVKRREEPRD